MAQTPPEPPPTIQTFDDVLKALGGPGAVGKIVGSSSANVCQWRARHGLFPAQFYLSIRVALLQRGYNDPPTRLFRFQRPTHRDQQQHEQHPGS